MEYLPIRIATLRPGAEVNFDIFILVAEKYVHYVRKADPFDGERIERLRAKGVRKLYIPEDSEPNYLNYLDAGLDQLQDKTVKVEERAAMVSGAIITEAENALHNVESESGYRRTEVRIQKVIEFLTSEDGALKNILASTGVAMDNFQHAANVTSLTLALAGKLGITQPRELLDLGLAGLLHDAALPKLGFSVDVDPAMLSVEELKKYQEHPTAVAHVLAGKPYINRTILELIANHEEAGEGAGFPGKKRMASLSLSSQVLNLCNAYDRFAALRKLPPLEAMKTFFNDKIGLFNLDHIRVLSTILK